MIALNLCATNVKGVSSLKLHRDLGFSQKSARHIEHRIRKMWDTAIPEKTVGLAEVDETYLGGEERNMHADRRKKLKGHGLRRYS